MLPAGWLVLASELFFSVFVGCRCYGVVACCGGFLMKSVEKRNETRRDETARGLAACADVFDGVLGMLSAASGGDDDWAARSAAAWSLAADESVDDDSRRSRLVEAFVCDGLASVLPSGEILAGCLSALAAWDSRRVVLPLPGGEWCCPDCSDPWSGRLVPLDWCADDGGWCCPVCGCWTASPSDDGCLRRPVDGNVSSPCAVVWSLAAGLSSSECVARSAAEWSASEVAAAAGDLVGSLRHVVRAEIYESVALGRSAGEIGDRAAAAADDWAAAGNGRADVELACCWSCGDGCAICCDKLLPYEGGR